MSNQVDLNKYQKFVEAVTSKESNELSTFKTRLDRLDGNYYNDSWEGGESSIDPKVNVSLMLTGSIGLCSEAGELIEIVKKMTFQGKPLNEENVFHMKRELGDIMWYWINTCRALHLDPNDVIAENVRKLEARYPGGKFDVYQSENRKEGDL